ncbi:MAG: long-chain fatty acid--CoA ligase [Anaerolineales bacterium]|nr:long-chain fatty acid--CoA ligase [Anaerolineales bacterium]MCB8954508.1 long-chain fatty acid--CoA ligase [Ardenticatenales bacterium]
MIPPSTEKPWLKQYDPGVPQHLDIPDHTIQDFLTQAAQNHPDKPAMIFKGTRINYRQFDQLTDAAAAALVANGFKKGDRAVVYMPNSPQFLIAYFGTLKAGGIVIATNPLYTERELTHQLADCGAETVFVLSRFYPLLKQVQKAGHTQVKRIIVSNIKEYLPVHLRLLYTLAKEKKEGDRVALEPGDMTLPDFLAAGRRAPKPTVKVNANDIALLQYTGGTTGLSKGAVGTHGNVVANVYMAKAWINNLVKPGQEVTLLALPLFHVYGMIGGMHLTIALAGAMVLIPNPREQEDVLGSVQKYRATLFPGVPAMYVAINNNPDVAAGKYDISSIRVCLSGAAPLLMDTKEKFEQLTGATLVEAFGLSEALVATHVNPLQGDVRAGSIGVPLPNVDARIVDPEDGEKVLGPNEVGELVIKSPSVMQGYWQMPTETENTLRDGWLFTGDIARMDDDGYFYIEDRKKDMIIAGGYNIYPREVEEVLMNHPAVKEVAVAGIKDPRRGETVKAWIVKNEGDATTEQEIVEWSKGQLAAYKYPRMVEFRDELPKSAALKVLKRELVRQHQEKVTA